MNVNAGDPAVAADTEAISQLVLRERQSRDRGWWADMAACFVPGAVIDMSWFSGPATDFIRDTRERSSDGVWGRHRLSPPAVRLSRDRAWAELPLSIEFETEVDGVAVDLVSYCRSQYRAQRESDGSWRLVRVTSIYERDTLTPSLPGTVLAIDPVALAGYRRSYRCLAWYFDRRGTPLPSDLLGDDRAADVARQYAAERAWLASS